MGDRGRVIMGVLLLLAGLAFVLDAAGYIDAWSVVGQTWPVVFILLGIAALMGQPRSTTSGVILIAIGAVLLTSTLNVIDLAIWQLAIPLVLIAIGAGMIVRGVRPNGERNGSDNLNVTTILGEQSINSRATAFRKGNLTSILGELKLDLRDAAVDARGATVDIFAMLGDVTVIVPADMKVHVNGMPILGDFQDKTAAPAAAPGDHPALNVTGVSLLADVKVRN